MRSRRPVDRILEHAQHAMGILRRRDNQRVGSADRRLARGEREPFAARFNIGVVELDRCDVFPACAMRYRLVCDIP
jgi:hypothetical protein